MRRWREIPRGAEETTGHGHPLFGLPVPLALAGLLVLTDHRPLAAVVAVGACALTGLNVWRPAAGARVAHAFARFGRAVAVGLSWALLTLVAVLVVIPVAAVAKLFGRDPLVTHPGTPSQWNDRPATAPARRTFGREVVRPDPSGPMTRSLARVPAAIGAVVAFLALNYGIGWVWDEYAGSHDIIADTSAEAADAGLAAVPAFADDDWADSYWADFDALRYDPVPFLLTRVADVEGELITSRNGVRRSYASPSAAEAPLEIWFFGGGALWGEGQRDVHTIPSEVARRAEGAEYPIRVLNFGQPGYTTWQSALLFEQELAVRPAPAFAVFYDGADDVAVQVESRTVGPSHYNADGMARALTGRTSAADQARDLWASYRDTSVVTRLADQIRGVFAADPAGAAEDDGSLVEHVLDLRSRSRSFIEAVADHHGVDTVIAWQAATGVDGDGGAYRRATEADDGALDLSAILDDRADAVFVDGVLTNEEGARRVAEALWAAILLRL